VNGTGAWTDATCTFNEVERMELQYRGEVTAQFSVNGGGTGGEFPINLLKQGKESWNKWYQTNSNTSWVKIAIDAPINVRGFGFVSANDMPQRDPDSVKVTVDGVVVGTFKLVYNARWQTLNFLDNINVTGKVFQFDFSNSKTKEIQLGEIIFYHLKGSL